MFNQALPARAVFRRGLNCPVNPLLPRPCTLRVANQYTCMVIANVTALVTAFGTEDVWGYLIRSPHI